MRWVPLKPKILISAARRKRNRVASLILSKGQNQKTRPEEKNIEKTNYPGDQVVQVDRHITQPSKAAVLLYDIIIIVVPVVTTSTTTSCSTAPASASDLS